MNFSRHLPLLFLLLFLSPLSGDVFLDMNGLVVMEIESTPILGGWKSDNSIPGYLGDEYYYWGGNLTLQTGIHVLEYHFKVSEAGTYRVALRNHNSNPDVTLDNDVFIAMDDGQFHKLYSHGGDSWNFNSTLEVGGNHLPPDYNLTAGEHILKLSARSADFRMDRIHIYDKARWDDLVAKSIYHSPSPIENGSGIREAAARIFITSRTNLVPYMVDCDGSLSNGADDNSVERYHWSDGEQHQQSSGASHLKTVYFFSPGDHTILLEIEDSGGNSSTKSVVVSGIPRTMGSIAPVKATASNSFANQLPARTIDEDLDTTWTTARTGEFIEYDFIREVILDSIQIMFKGRDQGTYTFDILSSQDGRIFSRQLENVQTSDNDQEFDVYELNGLQTRYLRILVTESTVPGFVNLKEVVFEGTPAPVPPVQAWKSTAIDFGDGVLGFPWFGYFWPASAGWFYHLEHGWTYGRGQNDQSVLFWQDSLGWFWTNSQVYPFLYLYDKGSWYWYLKETSSPDRWFFELDSNQWIQLGG